MANWVLKGLRTGIKTTPYPRQADDLPGVSPGRPSGTLLSSADRAEDLARRCPTGAIVSQNSGVAIEHGSCVHCFRCHGGENEEAAAWEPATNGLPMRARERPRSTRCTGSSGGRCTSALSMRGRAAPASARRASSTILITTCTASAFSSRRRRVMPTSCWSPARSLMRCGCPCARPMRRCRPQNGW